MDERTEHVHVNRFLEGAWFDGPEELRVDRAVIDSTVGDHLLAEQLFWLFALCMLRLAGAPEVVYDGISKLSQILWFTERADASRSELA